MSSLMERARVAAGSGEWEAAYALLDEADTAKLVGPPDLPLLAQVAYAAGHLDVTIDTWERAHAEAVRGGDMVSAAGAAVRLAMHILFDTALMAPVRGWLARADRLLEGHEPGPVHAWLAVVRAYERLLSGDIASAAHHATRAIALGVAHDPAAAAVGRVASARCVLLDGDMRAGLALLDEAGIAMLSGELDAISTGVVYCEVVCALQAAAHYDLAEQWTQAMERWARTNAIGSLHGRCRVHRAEILRLRGDCDAAEYEASAACDELRPYLRRELGWPLNELGRIRLQRGDVAGAERAFFEADECGWEAQPGLALVHLAKQEVELAAASIRYALEHPSNVPSKEQPPNTQLRLAPLLAAHVEISIAAGETEAARAATDELERIGAKFESKALVATAAAARAKVCMATGDRVGARASFERAARLWLEVGAPYEAALARTGLADVHRAEGNAQLAALERRGAAGLLEKIGASTPVPVVAVAVDVQGNVFRREGDTWCCAYGGQVARLRDLKGMHYLARLLAEPDRQFHVVELVALESGVPVSSPTDHAGALLDVRAKQAYRRRLAEIEEDLEDATTRNDLGRIAQTEAEREFLLRELSRAVGLSGHDRHASSTTERARASVTRAVRQAIDRVGEHHAVLAEHLRRTVRTGAHCSYVPAQRIRWST